MKSWVGEWGTIPKLRRQWKIIFTGVGTSLTLSQQTTTGEEHEVLMIAKQPMGRLQIRLTTIPPDQGVVEHWATVAWPLNQGSLFLVYRGETSLEKTPYFQRICKKN